MSYYIVKTMCYTNYFTLVSISKHFNDLTTSRRIETKCKIYWRILNLPLGHRGPRPALRLLKNTSTIEKPLLIDRLAFKLFENLSFIGSVVGVASPPLSMLFCAFSLVCTARYCPKNFIISRIFTQKKNTCLLPSTKIQNNKKFNIAFPECFFSAIGKQMPYKH